MADDAAMRAAFVRIGLSQAGATAIVNEQGISTIEELRLLTEDEIETLCKTVRRPGGTVVPQAAPGAAAAAAPAPVPNPGTAISLRAETNIKLANYYCKYRQKTSRATTPAEITLQNVRSITGLREWEQNHTDLKAPPNIINNKNWPKTFEAIVELLRANLGVTGIPLAYVVRDTEAVEADPQGGWATKQDEMIGRAPHVDAAGNATATFITDRQRTWELLASISRDHECWIYFKVGQRARDGRLAYRSAYNHYLGPNAVDNMATVAERRLANTTYDGEKKRWNFEKYSGVHVDAYLTIMDLKRHGHAGIDDRSRVRFLNDGIKTPSLDAVKTRIMSDAALRNDFDACVTLYRDMIAQQQAAEKKSLNISATSTTDKSNQKKTGPTISADKVEDRYYKPKDYAKLSDDAKLKLKRMREQRGGRSGGGDGQQSSKKQKMSKKEIRQIATAVSQMQLANNNNGNDDDDDASQAETEQADNRSNRNLTRQSGTRRRN